MKTLNVLIISTRRYPDTGGAAKQAFLQSKYLSFFDVHSTLLSCRPSGKNWNKNSQINKNFQIETLPFEAPGLKTNRLNVILFFLKFTIFGLIKTIRLIKKHEINIIHVHSPPPSGFIGFIVSKLFKIPYFYTLHGLDIPFILNLDLSISAKNSVKTIVVSKEMKKTLELRFG
ncbi:MAG: hypothetical protein EU550_00330, partial [Promethearchaeota archaeon]